MRLTRITLTIIALIIGAGFNLIVRKQLADVEPQLYQATEETMVDAAHVLAAFAEQEFQNGILEGSGLTKIMQAAKARKVKAKIYNHTKKNVGLDFYITDADGFVIFDSKHPERVGRDYSKFRDVALTLRGNYGARSSRTDEYNENSSVLHVAALLGDKQKPLGVLTVYKSQTDVLPIIQRRISEIWWGTGLVCGGILFCVAVVFIWQYRPIALLTKYAHSIEQGKRVPLPYLGLGKEVNTLARALQSMREALEGRRFAERYVQTLTHEMKSPLAAIIGAAELLEDNLETMPQADKQRFLGNIKAESLRADRLLTRLLELSALEGKSELDQTAELDLRDIAKRAIDQLHTLADIAGITLQMDAHHEPMRVRGDDFMLRAALTNLLENAVDFSPKGGYVRIELSSSNGSHQLTVVDQGAGIPEYAQAKVFERFFSLRHLSMGRKGTGLGLTLVKEAAELHLGTIRLEAAENGGTRAILEIPAL